MYGMPEPITLFDDQHGIIRFDYKIKLTQAQQQAMLNYLVWEGFIELPNFPPKDDYKLHPDLPK